MSQESGPTFEVKPKSLLFVAPPFIAGALLILLAIFLGQINETPPPARPEAHAEAAARLRAMASCGLLVAMAIASISYFEVNLRSFGLKTRRRLQNAYAVLAVGGLAIVGAGILWGPARFMGAEEICSVFNSFDGTAKDYRATYGLMWWLDLMPRCPNRHFTLLWGLDEVRKISGVLASSALALGAISCLAVPPSATRSDCRFQVQRLNAYLYLAAATLVADLLCVGALVRWPSFSMEPDRAASYASHVEALVLYWGVTWSIFIAVFYVPVAIALARSCIAAGNADRENSPNSEGPANGDGTPASELFGWLKAAIALLAPTLVGLLGTVFHL